ncbi:carboxymuconolactone decarboxylase family protein [Mesorhizobium sp. Cs1299R1N1]|uniref:carboxymuconolactone decarboxylase family protein n=1 Tax=Mesorhizobium sp. Cs1299R1N1 TaxID=3015172 RepID=UPI00301D0B1B
MRLPLLLPSDLSPDQRDLYDDMRNGIQSGFKGFEAINDDGALIGPWNPWLHFSRFGAPTWELVKALSASPTLPKPVREVAILVTGAHFHSAYELYAHVLVAEASGLAEETIATIVAGQRPVDLTSQQVAAYDVASALVSGRLLPDLVYRQAVKAFGADGAAELIYLTGLYSLVSVILNGFDVPVPESRNAL